ncbi:MAG: hypothetical protein J6Y71_00655 [Ruminococcus sp.]|nr:hypothetical protein [Ruminococcus sp.]
MDRYEKRARSIMERGDKIIADRKRRKAVLMRSGAFAFGTAAVLFIGVWANTLKAPKRPDADHSGIISETTTAVTTEVHDYVQTSLSTTVTTALSTDSVLTETTSVSSGTASLVTTVSLTPSQTSYTTISISALQTTTQTTMSAAAQSTNSTEALQTTEPKTTTNAQVSTTTTINHSTTQSDYPVTTIPYKTTAVIIPVTTVPYKTTTVSYNTEAIETYVTTTAPYRPVFPVPFTSDYEMMLGENFSEIPYYQGDSLVFTYTFVSDKYILQEADELSLVPHLYSDLLPDSITAQVFTLTSRYSSDMVALKYQGSRHYWLYIME